MKKKSNIILALDVTDKETALKIAEETKDCVDAIKIGYPLVLKTGLSIVTDLKKYGPIIADFKVADIPNTDRLICEHVFNAGAEAIIVQAFTGEDSLKECVKTAGEFGKKVFVVAEMSHPGGDTFFTKKVANKIVEMARDSGAYGIVAPATRPERITDLRKTIGDEMKIISPGVGKQGGSAKSTLDAGADWIIIGRSIYESENPKKAAEEFLEQIK